MVESETKKIIAVMMVSFPNYKPTNIDYTAKVWADMLEEYTYKQIDRALRAYIQTDTSGFAPSIGQLIDKVHTIEKPEQLSEMEAWSLVSRALRNGYYGAEQEFDKLPRIVQKAVGTPSQLRNWSQTSIESIENVIQSNFMRTYRAVVSREKEIEKMPVRIQEVIKTVNSDSMKRLEG